MSLPTYTALLELPEGQLVTAGRWPEATEARTWASSLVSAGLPVRFLAVVPFVESTDEAVAALAAAVGR